MGAIQDIQSRRKKLENGKPYLASNSSTSRRDFSIDYPQNLTNCQAFLTSSKYPDSLISLCHSSMFWGLCQNLHLFKVVPSFLDRIFHITWSVLKVQCLLTISLLIWFLETVNNNSLAIGFVNSLYSFVAHGDHSFFWSSSSTFSMVGRGVKGIGKRADMKLPFRVSFIKR